jgi:hypothetical protein
MDALEFTDRLTRLTGPELVAVAHALRTEHGSADGEVAWWRATIGVDAELKRRRLSRQAGLAAHGASQAVIGAATRAGILDERRGDVVAVARAACDVVRALVVHRHDAPATPSAAPLLSPWHTVTAA